MSMDGSAAAPGMRWCVYNWYRERPSHHMSGAAHSSYDEMVCVQLAQAETIIEWSCS